MRCNRIELSILRGTKTIFKNNTLMLFCKIFLYSDLILFHYIYILLLISCLILFCTY
jgi:hypothetical protein